MLRKRKFELLSTTTLVVKSSLKQSAQLLALRQMPSLTRHIQLVQSRQSGARAAFAEVQSRNQDLRKIEETMTQLAQMMQDVCAVLYRVVRRC